MKKEELKVLLEEQFLFNELFMERFFIYADHKRGCTYDDLTKGDVCTCGFQALINIWYKIKNSIDESGEKK